MLKAILALAVGVLATPAMAAVTGVEGATLAAQGGSYLVTVTGTPVGDESIGFTPRGGSELIEDDGSSAAVGAGAPVTIFAPQATGRYDLVVTENDRVLARLPVVIVQAFAKLMVPEAVKPGDYVGIAWDGPRGMDDEITLARPDDPVETWSDVSYLGDNPALLGMPEEEGQYEVRYLHRVGGEMQILASEPIKVDADAAYMAEVEAAGGTVALDMPAEAMTGAPFAVHTGGLDESWKLMFVAPGSDIAADGSGLGYAVNDPLELTAPSTAGDYEVVAEDGNDLIRARYAVKVVAASATLGFKGIVAGTALELSWTGPGGLLDEIVVAKAGSAPEDYAEQFYGPAADGNGTVDRPQGPGPWVMRYLQYVGGKYRVLAESPLELP